MRNFFKRSPAPAPLYSPATVAAERNHDVLYRGLKAQLDADPLNQLPTALGAIAEPELEEELQAELAADLVGEDDFDYSPHARFKLKARIKERAKQDHEGAHVIVILGVPAQADGRESEGLRARINQGYREALKDPKAKILVTGSAVGNSHFEAEVMKRGLMERGIKEKRIIVEPQAKITIGNATRGWLLLQKALPQAAPITRMVVVSEPYHAVRSLRIFGELLAHVSPNTTLRAGLTERILAVPSRTAGFKANTAHASVQQLISKEAVRELSRTLDEKWKIMHGW